MRFRTLQRDKKLTNSIAKHPSTGLKTRVNVNAEMNPAIQKASLVSISKSIVKWWKQVADVKCSNNEFSVTLLPARLSLFAISVSRLGNEGFREEM